MKRGQPALRLKRGHETARSHPWIFKADVAEVSDVEPGAEVTIVGFGELVGAPLSIMLGQKILPAADRLGVAASLLEDLRAFRLSAKALARDATDEAQRALLGGLQQTFKILINSFYGYLAFSHVQVRVDAWLHAMDPNKVADEGYQLSQGWFAFASGGMVGTGLGLGSPTLIPYVGSDFILAAFGEELGMLGVAAMLLLYLVILLRTLPAVLERGAR